MCRRTDGNDHDDNQGRKNRRREYANYNDGHQGACNSTGGHRPGGCGVPWTMGRNCSLLLWASLLPILCPIRRFFHLPLRGGRTRPSRPPITVKCARSRLRRNERTFIFKSTIGTMEKRVRTITEFEAEATRFAHTLAPPPPPPARRPPPPPPPGPRRSSRFRASSVQGRPLLQKRSRVLSVLRKSYTAPHLYWKKFTPLESSRTRVLTGQVYSSSNWCTSMHIDLRKGLTSLRLVLMH